MCSCDAEGFHEFFQRRCIVPSHRHHAVVEHHCSQPVDPVRRLRVDFCHRLLRRRQVRRIVLCHDHRHVHHFRDGSSGAVQGQRIAQARPPGCAPCGLVEKDRFPEDRCNGDRCLGCTPHTACNGIAEGFRGHQPFLDVVLQRIARAIVIVNIERERPAARHI